MTGSEFDRAHKQWLAVSFDRAAPSYDLVGDSYHEHLGSRLVLAAEIGPGCRVLDVACGRGAVLLAAARRAGGTGSVVGIDLSEVMVHEANDALRASALDGQVEVRVMDAERLDFAADGVEPMAVRP